MTDVIERVRRANPVPDASRPFPDPESFRQVVMEKSGLGLLDPLPAPGRKPTPRGGRVAAIAFAVVIVVGVVGTVVVSTGDDRGPGSLVAQQPVGPIGAVERFFAAWETNDFDTVLSALTADFSAPVPPGMNALEFGPRFMEWLEPRGGKFVVSDCVETRESAVSCHVAYQDALHDALGLDGTIVGFSVRDGLVARFGLPNYGSADIALRDFARLVDPERFDAVCADPGDGSVLLLPRSGVALTAECGQFMADQVPALIATLE